MTAGRAGRGAAGQHDLFGAPEPPPPPAPRRRTPQPAPTDAEATPPAAPETPAPPVETRIETRVEVRYLPAPAPSPDQLAEGLGSAELDALAAALPDEALAHLVLAALRQLRRRLARAGGARPGKGKGVVSPLERAARQVAAELGGAGDDAA